MLTIFTSPKPFSGHVDMIQRNAIGSWLQLGPEVEVLLVGDEQGMAEVAHEQGVRHLPRVRRNECGTPLLSSIFELAHQEARHPVLCYVNADIILLDDLLPSVEQAARRFKRFLIVGRRWDLDVADRLAFGPGWEDDFRRRIESEGELHPPTGSDYFVFPHSMFRRLPPFALGRAGWDNWVIFAGRRAHVPVVDGTGSITVVHQTHDYSHLPDGQPHFRMPESKANVEMGGGRATVFTILDTTWRYGPNGLTRKPWSEPNLARSLEARVYALLGLAPLVRAARLALHPVETFTYYMSAVRRRLGRIVRRGRSEHLRR